MKILLIPFLAFAILFSVESAAAEIINRVDITTDDKGVHYSLFGEKGDLPENLDDILKIVTRKARGGNYEIWITPDHQTTFDTVVRLLERLKAAGATRFRIDGAFRRKSGTRRIDFLYMDLSSKSLREDSLDLNR